MLFIVINMWIKYIKYYLYLEFNYIIKRYIKWNEIKLIFDEINSSWYGWIEEIEWGCVVWENI